MAEIAVYKKVALPAELLLSKSHNHKLILPFEMASRFIAYVPKPTKEKHGSKPLDKIGNSDGSRDKTVRTSFTQEEVCAAPGTPSVWI
jgi:hypothetical protein